VALGCRLQLRKSGRISLSLEAANHAIVVRLTILLLCLLLFSLCGLALVTKMWRHSSVDMINLGNFRLHQPRSTSPCFPRNGFLDERPQDLLCEDLAITRDMRVIYDGFFSWTVVKADEIAREWCADRSIWHSLRSKTCFISDNSSKPLASNYVNCDRLARIVVGSKFVKDEVDEGIDSGYGLELYAS